MLFNDKFTHHCEPIPQDGRSSQDLWDHCKLNPGHKYFTPVPDFKANFLDPYNERYTDKEKECIRSMIDSTVRITVDCVSKRRPQKYPRTNEAYPFIEDLGTRRQRWGTGYVLNREVKTIRDRPCPCPSCKQIEIPKDIYWEVAISTAAHVVFDEVEAETTVVELFFDDSDSIKGVSCVYGDSVCEEDQERYDTDYCVMLCVTHEAELANTLKSIVERKQHLAGTRMPNGIKISHPHGMPKMVSLGVVDQKCYIPDSDTFLASLRQENVKFELCDGERVEQSSSKPVGQMRQDICSNYYELAEMLQFTNQSNDLTNGYDFKTNREALDNLILLLRCYSKVSNSDSFRHDPNATIYATTLLDEITTVLYPSQRNKISDFEKSIKEGCNENCVREPIWPKLYNALCSVICSLPKNGFVSLESTGLQVSHFKNKSEFTLLGSEDGNTIFFIPRNPLLKLRRHFFGDKLFWGTISNVLLVFTETNRDEIIKAVQLVDVLFYVPTEAVKNIHFESFSSISYSMTSCNGCSGARVYAQDALAEFETEGLFKHNHHFGYDPDAVLSISGRVREGRLYLSSIHNKRIKIWF